jgi:hypothetical protein
MDFYDCCNIAHMTLDDLEKWNDGIVRPVFLVCNWLGDKHTAEWNLYYGKDSSGCYSLSQTGMNGWISTIYQKDNYEKQWIAFKEKPDCIDFLS